MDSASGTASASIAPPPAVLPAAAAAPSATHGRRRVQSIDIIRGVVIVLMALDHVRDFVTDARFQPEDLSRASAALFATRWITHFCAPTFFLLAGVGIGLLSRRRPAGEVSRFLLTRGVWLLFLELVLTPIGWHMSFDLLPAFALVLWALGWSMIVMALLVRVPRAALAALSVLVIFGHNLLDPIRPDALGGLAWLWQVLHVPGFVVPDVLLIGYPLVPWVAVMSLGYVLAAVYRWEAPARRRFLIGTGIAATALFVALRALNGYGNPSPWTEQRTAALTVASFLNVLKYPPSLDFLLMTLGPALVALALAEHMRGRIAGWLSVYGRVPLFFYVTHIFVAHAAGILLAAMQSGAPMRITAVRDPAGIPDWYGLPLAGVYLVWLMVVVLLYFPSRWFARLKDRRSDGWLQYL